MCLKKILTPDPSFAIFMTIANETREDPSEDLLQSKIKKKLYRNIDKNT
jgi:hypothetical protein